MKKILMISIILVLGFNMSLFANPILNLFCKPVAKQATKQAVKQTTKQAAKQATKQGVKTIGRETAESGVKAGLKQGAKALVKNSDNVALPLMKRAALETAEHGVASPKIMQKLVFNYGEDVALTIIKKVPPSEIPMFLRYVEAADSPATKKLFFECFKKEGSDLFKRITPSMVLATGLSAAMLYGTHRATEPLVEVGDSIKKNPEVAKDVVNKASEELRTFLTALLAKPLLFISIIFGLIILNKFGIFGKFYNFIKGNNPQQSICSERLSGRPIKPIEAVVCEAYSVKN